MGSEGARKGLLGRVIAFALAGAVLVAIVVYGVRNPELVTDAWARLRSVPPVWAVPLFVLAVVNIVVFPLTAPAAIASIPYRVAFLSRHAGFAISNLLPGGGAVSAAAQFSVMARMGVGRPEALATVTADALAVIVMVLALPIVVLPLALLTGVSLAGAAVWASVIGGAAGAVVVAVSVAVTWRPVFGRRVAMCLEKPVNGVLRRFGDRSVDIAGKVEEFSSVIGGVLRDRGGLLAASTLVAQLMPCLILTVCLAAVQGQGAWLGVPFAFALAFLATMVPVTPGGVGTADAVLVSTLVLFGFSSADALAATVAWRAVWMGTQTLVGLVTIPVGITGGVRA